MDKTLYLRLWWIILILAALIIGAAAGYMVTDPKFEATARFETGVYDFTIISTPFRDAEHAAGSLTETINLLGEITKTRPNKIIIGIRNVDATWKNTIIGGVLGIGLAIGLIWVIEGQNREKNQQGRTPPDT